MDSYNGNRIGGDNMKMSEIVKLALDGKYDEAISQIKELPPRAVGEFIDGVQDKGGTLLKTS